MDRHYGMPEHVLFDILLYLPVMSLLRFKSVCKSWFSLIESSSFIIQHLNRNNDEENNLIVFSNYHDYDLTPSRYVKRWFLLSGSQYEKCANIDFERLLWYPNESILLIGSCNGIVCLEYPDGPDIALWNPALKQLRPLPQPSAELANSVCYTAFGTLFGIDGKTTDHKVLKIFDLDTEKYELLSNQVEVYSLRDNSWRIIHKDSILPFSTDFHGIYATFMNGKCFWMTNGIVSPYLLSFDFADEVFGTMSLPDGHHHFDFIELDIYNDKIAHIRVRDWNLFEHDFNAFGYKLEIWILGEFGVKESWSKLYNLSLLYHDYCKMGLSKNGEFLMLTDFEDLIGDRHEKLYLYNLHTQEGKYLPYYPYRFINYTASLISIKSENSI